MSTTETGWPLKNLRIKNFNSRLNQIPDMLKNKEKSDVDDEDEIRQGKLGTVCSEAHHLHCPRL